MGNALNKLIRYGEFEELYKVYKALSTNEEKRKFLAKAFAEDESLGKLYTDYKAFPTIEKKKQLQTKFNEFQIAFQFYDYISENLTKIEEESCNNINLRKNLSPSSLNTNDIV